MKKIRKGKQLSLINPKGAGRPAKNDQGIRHTSRKKFQKALSLLLTIKVRENKADIQSKRMLKRLHHAIYRARLKGLRIIHYTLEYNHVHLLVEAGNHEILHKGMQALGISLSKSINRLKNKKGAVYKHRYHFRQISSPRDLRNVVNYILNNGIKHKRCDTRENPYNSLGIQRENHLDNLTIFRIKSFLFHACEGPRQSERIR